MSWYVYLASTEKSQNNKKNTLESRDADLFQFPKYLNFSLYMHTAVLGAEIYEPILLISVQYCLCCC